MKEFQVAFPKEGATTHLLMTPLGRNQYRLEESSVLLEEPIFFHDVILASRRFGRGLQFQQLVEKSGLRVYDFLLTEKLAGSQEIQDLLRRVEGEGGHWEMIFGGILFIHMPLEAIINPDDEIQLLAASDDLQPAALAPPQNTSPISISFDLR